ncbi:MAG TPA: acetyl-CoA carboxylase carboxyl transferase subunit alpha [Lentisphaeria bacterium]|nr:MAG: acetyl-CoA carboxylase carboxyltransferase subunit alpha [Lentisphaerae bacterium GWF2_38_69]HBM15792.1 acetyl-CoA carboxylase carboxyl transferase subunit alpha [Lentisphaeria bacterium]
MLTTVLEFEKPISELEIKIKELESLSESNHIDVSEEITVLSKKLEETKKKVYSDLTPWQRVQLARHPNRPYTLDYIERIFTDFIELHGDRRFAEDPAIVGGFAKLDGMPVMLIGTQKGRNIKENVYRNFGCPHPEGYRKAIRLMALADLAHIPIITFIDTPGAFPGVASEERHVGEAIAVNLRDMFSLNVPVLAIVIGEGGSGGALGIGVGNKVLIMEHAYYSVITPEGCAAILWKDRTFSPKAAEALKLISSELFKMGLVDDIIPEPIGGAHYNYDKAAELVKKAIIKNLKDLSSKTQETLKEERYQRFRHIGKFTEEKIIKEEIPSIPVQ